MATRRAASQEVHRLDGMIEANEQADRVLIPALWFETDAYGAAVSGILKSIELGLASPSIGQGDEVETLEAIRELFFKIDPLAKRD